MSINAFVHPEAIIGKNVTIEPFAYIDRNVVIGDNTWIGPHVTIFSGGRIGKHCKIFPGAVISAIPQDLKFEGENTTAEVGDYTTIREYVTINRGTKDRMTTKVGSHCLLMAYVHIAHDCLVGDHCIFANGVNLAGHVVVEEYAILEGLVAVQQFIKIGAHSFVTGASLVRKNIPPFVKAGREPVSYLGVNSVGLKRRGFDNHIIRQIEDAYRLIYVQHSNVSKAIALVEQEIPFSEEKLKILNFIKDSEKGVMGGAKLG
jgi:UDP-N-acetylglucosamine acyltransferase